MTLTKARIVDKNTVQNGFPGRKSIEIMETILGMIKTILESGDDVLISGFGKFYLQSKRQRMGRNPATGEDLILDPRKVVTFRYSGKSRERINEKG